VLRLFDIWKKFDNWVLKGVDLDVAGRVLIHGHNGSGKTTLVRIAVGLLAPTRGSVERAGRLGVSLQHPLLHPDLTVEENLKFYARAVGAAYRELAEELGLVPYLKTRFAHLSFGWKRRADLARALLGGPDVLVLDEPLIGLDPEARRVVADALNRRGVSMLITASSPCEYLQLRIDRFYQIVDGKLVPTQPPCSSS